MKAWNRLAIKIKKVGNQTAFKLDLCEFSNGIIKMGLFGIVGDYDYLC